MKALPSSLHCNFVTTKECVIDYIFPNVQWLNFKKCQKIQLLFSKFKKQFLNFQLESVEYSDACIWEFWNL